MTEEPLAVCPFCGSELLNRGRRFTRHGPMSRKAPALPVSEPQRHILEAVAASPQIPNQVRQRARILLKAADGVSKHCARVEHRASRSDTVAQAVRSRRRPPALGCEPLSASETRFLRELSVRVRNSEAVALRDPVMPVANGFFGWFVGISLAACLEWFLPVCCSSFRPFRTAVITVCVVDNLAVRQHTAFVTTEL